ncbi:MAG: hypothetical protein GIS02_06080 [Methanosarcinales archaeon]|uniref:Uncharacterized protein n=1 Tax=Candidatus Ethanoperedens thermophilum TaxID=2766897 RepID=A0A848DC02_9EURY|nr:hypothetical protein [Candidatus Ethanoperedens thermophilum]
MQKLKERDTNTPPNTAPVRCNCDPVLKVPRGKDGVQDSKTSFNSSEEHLLQPAGGLKANTLVFVIIQEVCAIPPRPRGRGLLAQVR